MMMIMVYIMNTLQVERESRDRREDDRGRFHFSHSPHTARLVSFQWNPDAMRYVSLRSRQHPKMCSHFYTTN